ncbi:MAG TPA: hypothetical protein DCL86_09250 [Bacteroidales bacterium]|nr:hypothetical protein [Bacteroidales bacterium]
MACNCHLPAFKNSAAGFDLPALQLMPTQRWAKVAELYMLRFVNDKDRAIMVPSLTRNPL